MLYGQQIKTSFLSKQSFFYVQRSSDRVSRRYQTIFAGKTYGASRNNKKNKKKINPADLFITFPNFERMDTPKLMKMPQQDLDDLLRQIGIPLGGDKAEQVQKLKQFMQNLNSSTYMKNTIRERKEQIKVAQEQELREGEKYIQDGSMIVDDYITLPRFDGDKQSIKQLNTGLGVTWMGTSSGSPTNTRNVSCIALRTPDCTLLVDCGEGTCNQIEKFDLDPFSIKAIFVTHLHGDHCFGIPGLIKYLEAFYKAAKANEISDKNGYEQEDDLTIYGPPGLHKLIASAFSYTNTKCGLRVSVYEYATETDGSKAAIPVDPSGRIRFGKHGPKPPDGPVNVKGKLKGIPVVEGSFWEMQTKYGIRVTASQLIHRLPCWGYVFEEEKDNGRKVVLLGDTCNSNSLIPVAKNADMLSHEATFCKGLESKARDAMHSTAEMAGNFARKINTRALILTHFSSRYKSLAMKGEGEQVVEEVDQNKFDIAQLIRQAQRTYGYDSVAAAQDGLTFHVPQRQM